jgi:ABC-type multidrug transport system ATPase subunit
MGKEPTYKPVPELVEDVANRVAILREGRVAAFDTMDGLRQSSGVNAKLDEVYERLVGDGSLDNIDRYFEERP